MGHRRIIRQTGGYTVVAFQRLPFRVLLMILSSLLR